MLAYEVPEECLVLSGQSESPLPRPHEVYLRGVLRQWVRRCVRCAASGRRGSRCFGYRGVSGTTRRTLGRFGGFWSISVVVSKLLNTGTFILGVVLLRFFNLRLSIGVWFQNCSQVFLKLYTMGAPAFVVLFLVLSLAIFWHRI